MKVGAYLCIVWIDSLILMWLQLLQLYLKQFFFFFLVNITNQMEYIIPLWVYIFMKKRKKPVDIYFILKFSQNRNSTE